MRKLILLLFFPVQLVFGQNPISLDSCYSWARENYPNLKKGELWQEITSLHQENNKTNYLPQLTLNGQATYQSDVTTINLAIPGITLPIVSKDQYKVYAEFRQTIWDGGITDASQQLEDAILKSNLSELEIEIYKLNDQVSQAFFTALIVDKQAEVLIAQKEVLTEKLKLVESGIKNGMVEKSSALIIQAELLNLQQNDIQLKAGKNAALKMLSILTGKPELEKAKLQFNENQIVSNDITMRPEFQLFASQANQLETQMHLLDKTRNPKLFGFGQLGYGRPGLNMLNDNFSDFYMVGVGVSWNAFDWKNTFRKKQVMQIQQQMIQKQEATFTQNIQMLLVQQNEQIEKLKRMLETDQQMVSLRTEITKSAASKLENQTITASEYIQELQAETVSKLNYELHKTQLNEALEKYEIIRGK